MKLAKKVLACVVAFALIATLAISAFAADATLVVNAPATASVGDTVTVVAAINACKGLQSTTVTLGYDASALELTGTKGAVIDGASAQGGKVSDGVVNFAIAYTDKATVDSTELFTVTFKVLKEGKTTVTLEVLDGDISGIDNAAAGSAVIDAAIVTTTEPTTGAPVVTGDKQSTTPNKETPKTGDAGIAVAAGLVVLAGAAFVASKKTK